MTELRSVGLVLGAGGTAGAHWIRGALDGLHTHSSFRPEHASVLVGTSIGAIKAAGIGPHRPPPRDVVETLARFGDVPRRPGWRSAALASVRRAGGRAVAVASGAGTPDPFDWVETIHPETVAQVCSLRRWRPQRRVATVAEAGDAPREIAASAAIPFGARPVEIGGASYVDGAVWSVTNADVASPESLDVLIVIAPLVATSGGTLVSGLGRHQLAMEIEPWRRAGKPVLVLAPSDAHYAGRDDWEQHRADGFALASYVAEAARTKPSR